MHHAGSWLADASGASLWHTLLQAERCRPGKVIQVYTAL